MAAVVVHRRALRLISAAIARLADSDKSSAAIDLFYDVMQKLLESSDLDPAAASTVARAAGGAFHFDPACLVKRLQRDTKRRSANTRRPRVAAEKPPSAEAQEARARRLAADPIAQAWLRGLGVDDGALVRFGIGLDPEYEAQTGEVRGPFITLPLRRADGAVAKKFIRIPVPADIRARSIAWESPGPPQSFYGPDSGAKALVVCVVDLPDLLAVSQAVAGRSLPVRLISSSCHDDSPAEWEASTFWREWRCVVVASRTALARRKSVVAASRAAGCRVADLDVGPIWPTSPRSKAAISAFCAALDELSSLY